MEEMESQIREEIRKGSGGSHAGPRALALPPDPLTATCLPARLRRAADGHDGPDQGAEPQPGHPLPGVQALRDPHLLPQGQGRLPLAGDTSGVPILNKYAAMARERKLDEQFIGQVFTAIHDASVNLQTKVFNGTI